MEDVDWLSHVVDIDIDFDGTSTVSPSRSEEASTKRLLGKIPSEFGPFISPKHFSVMGHKLTVSNVLAGRRVALMSFEELCGHTLGSVDYIGKTSSSGYYYYYYLFTFLLYIYIYMVMSVYYYYYILFMYLCIELGKRFSVIFLYNVPEIPIQHRNEVCC